MNNDTTWNLLYHEKVLHFFKPDLQVTMYLKVKMFSICKLWPYSWN